MSAGTVPNAIFDRIGGVLVRGLNGLSVEQLRQQPAGLESNPIGWIAWHLTRVHDGNFANLLGKQEVWVSGGWSERFGLPAEIGSGSGSTLDEVRAFDPLNAETLIGYWEAARELSREFLGQLTDAGLDTPTPPRNAVSDETYTTTIARVTSDTSQHIGQVAYARGLVDRQGWYGV
jgi:hypothetical protein